MIAGKSKNKFLFSSINEIELGSRTGLYQVAAPGGDPAVQDKVKEIKAAFEKNTSGDTLTQFVDKARGGNEMDKAGGDAYTLAKGTATEKEALLNNMTIKDVEAIKDYNLTLKAANAIAAKDPEASKDAVTISQGQITNATIASQVVKQHTDQIIKNTLNAEFKVPEGVKPEEYYAQRETERQEAVKLAGGKEKFDAAYSKENMKFTVKEHDFAVNNNIDISSDVANKGINAKEKAATRGKD